jgi:hypothetical protein
MPARTDNLTWTVHRAKENPAKTVVAAVFILAFVGFSWAVFGPVLGMLAIVVLFLALNTYFLPVTYTFTDKGIEVDKRMFTARYEWKQFRRWFRTTGGIVVSPFSRRTFLDNFRGVHLLLPVVQRQTPSAERRTEDTEERQTPRCLTGAVEANAERRTPSNSERHSPFAIRQSPESVREEEIVAYLEKRFAPAPLDDRLRLEEPDEVRRQKPE